MLFPYLECFTDLDGDVCIVNCSGNFSMVNPPVIKINDAPLKYGNMCLDNSSDTRMYCKFQTKFTIGVKIRDYGTHGFECDPHRIRRGTICSFTMIFGE